jgi:hypothetical protein
MNNEFGKKGMNSSGPKPAHGYSLAARNRPKGRRGPRLPAQPTAENGRDRPGASARCERRVINGHRASESHSGTLASGEQDDEEWRRQLKHDEGDALGMVREVGAHRSGMASRRWQK